MKRLHRSSVLLVVAGLVVLGLAASALAAPDVSAERTVQNAWQLAQQSGVYHFNTEIVQTTQPAPRLTNVGRTSRVETLNLEGDTNLPQQELMLTLWKDGGSAQNARDGVEIQVKADGAFGRQIGGEWQAIEDVSGVFAPDRDVLAYLAGARHIQQVNLTTDYAVAATQYIFEVDGPALGAYLRNQLEDELQRSGKLPAGLSLDIAREYRDMVGSGQVWLDASGLPLRLTVNVEYPQQANGEQVSASIKTDFANFKPVVTGQAGVLPAFLSNLQRSLNRTLTDWREVSVQIGLLLAWSGLMLFLMTQLNSKKVYAAISIAIIFSMIGTPLLQSGQVSAFYDQQNAKQVELDRAAAEQTQRAALQNRLLTSDWDPLQDPLATTNQQPSGTVGQSVMALAATPEPTSDADGDGLTYLQESRLGTDPNNIDTDADSLRDDLEIKGFALGGKTWYSDPNYPDTNNDGLLDAQECWRTLPAVLPSNQACDQDTDADGTPDLFDRDNDGDAVADRVDLSPGQALNNPQPFSATNPFKLIIDNLQRDASGAAYPVLVDFQLRPTKPDHLAYALNVLDWPSGDDKGQIQRTTDTTFADLMSPPPASDNANWNGDMRLTPMLEIKLTGGLMPLPLTTPRASVRVTGLNNGSRWISATVNFDQQGANTRLSFQFQDAASVERVQVVTGSCQMTGQPAVFDQTSVTSGAQIVVNNQNLLHWLDGAHALMLVQGGQVACANLVDLPNGPYPTQMFDTAKLGSYNITVRDADTNGNVVVYVPLNVVKDETGGGKAAFAARMLYWPNNPSTWGNAHEVRVNWLVQVLDDDGNMDTVQVYPETWTLTGLSVREDRGLDLAVAFENPTGDANSAADDRLWQVSRGLEAAWSSARDQNQDGQRDLTLSGFKARFDNVNNDTTALQNRWGVPGGAIKVLTYTYATQDDLVRIPTELTPRVLADYFTSGGQPLSAAPTLLFAREERYRTASLDMTDGVIAISGAQATVNMATDKISVDVLASTSWSPYRYRGGAWEAYPLAEYYDTLGQQLRTVLSSRYAADGPSTLTGAATSASAFYMAKVFGMSRVVQSGGLVLEETEEVESDPSLAADMVDQTGGVISFMADVVAEDYFDALKPATGVTLESVEIPTTTKGKLKLLGDVALDKFTPAWGTSWRERALNLADPTGTPLGVASLGLSLVGSNLGGDTGTVIEQITGGLEILSALKDLKEGYDAFKKASQGVQTLTGLANKIKATTGSLQKASAKAGMIGLVVTIGVGAGAFIAQWASGAFGSFWSLQFNAALADTIATAVAAVIMLAISLIPVIGQIIAAVVALIDAVIAGICGLIDAVADGAATGNSVGQWFCKGISGLLSYAIAWGIYSQTSLVGNMQDKDRTRLANFTPALVKPEMGFVVSNTVNYKMNVETALTLSDVPIDWKAAFYFWQYTYDNLDSATFRYVLQPEKKAIQGVERDQMENDWQRQDGYFDGEDALVNTVSLAANDVLGETGINRRAKLYLTEAYAVPTQECWVLPTPPVGLPLIPICYIRTDDNDGESKFTDLGQTVQWDVFPATLDDFYACESGDPNHACHTDGGYSLAWGQGKEDTLTFPRMKDFDGDGLLNPADGGNDPNDSKWDSDRDGLSDPFEIERGSDPQLYDADEDGLSDYDEIRLGANSARKDSDGDGLTDKQEVDGWAMVYDITNGAQLTTWVTSDPLAIDGDGDGLTDFQERSFGFHPRVVNDPNVLSYTSQAREANAPIGLWRFEETTGATLFSDVSGGINNGQCTGEACPVAGHSGRYGTGLIFDGSNDALNAGRAITLNNSSFTVAFWAKRSAIDGQNHFAIGQGAAGTNLALQLGFRSNNTFTCAFYGNDLNTSAAYTDTDWHHWACTYDATSKARIIYRDGVQVAQNTASSNYQGSGEWLVGQAPWGEAFRGALDEVLVFPVALPTAKIQEQRDARYDLNDNLVKPGDVIAYTGEVENQLYGKYIDGLLFTDLPNGLESAVPPTNFTLSPNTRQTIAGNITVKANASSGRSPLTQVAGGVTRDTYQSVDVGQPIVKMSLEENGGNTYPFSSGLSATCFGASCPSQAYGIGGGFGQMFSGDDYLNLSHNSLNLSNSSFTFSVWLYPKGGGPWRGIWGDDFWRATGYPGLAINDTTLRFGFGTGSTWLQHDTYNAVQINTWNHVVATFDGNTYRLYVNGNLKDQTSDPFSGQHPVYKTEFSLGRAASRSSLYLGELRLDDEDDAGGSAEGCLAWNGNQIWEKWDFEGDTTYPLNQWLTFSGSGKLQLWEDDDEPYCGGQPNGGDDVAGTWTFNSNELERSITLNFDDELTGKISGKFENPAAPLNGDLDEFLVYNRALSSEEVLKLYRAGVMTTDLRFDDPPGTGRSGQGFANAVALADNRQGKCSGAACPTAGVPGRVNSAVLFDGVDDSVQLSEAATLGLKKHDFTVAAWVNVSQFNGGDETVLGTDSGNTNQGLHLVIRNQKPYLGFTGNDLAGNTTLSANTWYHVVWRYSAFNGEQAIFVNGVKDSSRFTSNSFEGSGQVSVGRWAGSNFFNGRLDEVRIYQQALSDVEVASLYQEAPRVLLHLDESASSFAFKDDGNLPYGQRCASVRFERIELFSNSYAYDFKLYFNDQLLASTWYPSAFYGVESKYCDTGRIKATAQTNHGLVELNWTLNNYSDPGTWSVDSQGLDFRLFYTLYDDYTYSPLSCTDCPTAGRKGQVGLAAMFDGVNDRLVMPKANLIGLKDSSFTVMAWVRGDYFAPSGDNAILGTDQASADQGLQLIVRGGKPYMGFFGNDLAGTTDLKPNYWYHLTWRYDKAKHEQAIFVNGYKDVSATGHNPFQGSGEVYVGRALGGKYFNGRLDEVTFYTRALDEFYIRDIALYQYRWFEERQTHEMTIDAENPTTSLRSYQSGVANYRPNQAVVLDVQAADRTSRVTLAELGLRRNTQTDLAWQYAPECIDSAGNGAWCPTFDPTVLGGEGTYILQTRAIDAVGNRGTSNDYVLYVDATPPSAVNGNFTPGGLISARPVTNTTDRWSVPLTGTATDPNLSSGAAGSGVTSLIITLWDADGKVAGEGPQPATIANGQWSIAYAIDTPSPTGVYTVTAEAVDAVGNRPAGAFTVGLIRVDGTAPTGGLDTANLPISGLITGTLPVATVTTTLTTTVVSRAPVWADAVLYFPLNEPANATTFTDESGNGGHGVCSDPACPTTGLGGKFGQAAQFDGTADHLSAPLNLANQSFTVAFWAKRAASGQYDFAVGQGAAGDNQGLQIGFRNTDLFTCAFYGNDLNTSATYTDSDWHHWACTYDATTRARKIYRDGVSVAQDTAWANYQGSGTLFIGQAPWGDYFGGALDEVQVYTRTLSAAAISGLLTSVSPATIEPPLLAGATMRLRLDEPSGASAYADSSGNRYTGSCSGLACPISGVAGKFGLAAQFDGTNNGLVAGQAKLANQSFTVAFWAKRTAANRWDVAVGQGTDSTHQGLHIGFRDTNTFTCAFYGNDLSTTATYTDADWHHWACTYDATSKARIIYRDGVNVAQDVAAANYQGTGDLLVGKAPWGRNFSGTLDDVQVYRRTLSASEINALTVGAATVVNAPALLPGAALRLKLDEAAGATTFSDGSSAARSVTCSGTACPTLAVSGRFDRAVRFDGTTDYLSAGSGLNLANQSFTLAFWARRGSSGTHDFALGQGTNSNNQGLQVGFRNTDKFTCAFYGNDLDTTATYTDSDWHHWACTYDAASKARIIYRDGVNVAQDVAAANYQGSGEWLIGKAPWGDFFDGALDDIHVYARVLNASELQALTTGAVAADATQPVNTAFQLRGWASELPNLPGAWLHLRLDEAISATTFIDEAYAHLSVTCSGATCPTAGVSGQFGQAAQFDGVDDYATVNAPITLTAQSFTVALWAKRASTGRLEMAIGQGTNSNNRGLHLGFRDNNTFTCGFYGNDLNTSATYTDANWHHWACTFEADTRARVLYRDGVIVARDTATAPYQGNGSLFMGKAPWGNPFQGALDEVGVYDRALGADEVRALAQAQVAGVKDVSLALSPLSVGNAPLTPAGQVLYLALNETTDANGNVTFQDGSGLAHNGTCTAGACPATGVARPTGAAVRLDGVDDAVSASEIDLANRSFSVAFWAQRSALNRSDYILAQGARGDNQSLHLGFRSNNQFTCAFYGNDLNTTAVYTDTDWHHWTCTYDAASRARTIYRDGVNVAQDVASANYQGSGELRLGRTPWDDYFYGAVDEVRIFTRTLTTGDVQALINTGPLLVLPFEETSVTNGALLRDASGWNRRVTLNTGDECRTFDSTDTPLSIRPAGYFPPSNASVLVSSIAVPTDFSGAVGDANVTLSINGDGLYGMDMSLIAPNGTAVSLFESATYNTNRLSNTTLDDEASTPVKDGWWWPGYDNASFRPKQPLSAVDGQPGAGNWQLKVSNPFSAWGVNAVGALSSWRLTLCPNLSTLDKSTVGKIEAHAIQLDGVDDTINAGPMNDLAGRSFTVAFWARRVTINSRPHFVVGQGSTTSQRGLQIGFRDNSKFTCAFYDNDLTTAAAYTDTDWHHWACTYDVVTAQRAIYRDGVRVAQDTPTSTYLGSGDLWIGRGPTYGYFGGAVDEVHIYPQALAQADILALTQTSRQSTVLTPNGTGVANWSYTVPTVEGNYRLNLYGTDAAAVSGPGREIWRGEIDTQAPQVSVQKTVVGNKYRYTTVARDLNLVELGFRSPCGAGVITDRAYVDYGSSNTRRLNQLTAVCDQTTPTWSEVGSISSYLGPQLRDVAVSGQYVYGVTPSYPRGLYVYDVSNPQQPSQVAQYDYEGLQDIALKGNYAYIAAGSSNLVIMNISSPTAPTLVTQVGGSWTNSKGIAVSGNYAYLTDPNHGLVIYNISDPASPRYVATNAVRPYWENPPQVNDLAIAGNYAYLADGDEGLKIFNVSTPSNPKLTGSFDTSGYANDVVVSGTYAYVADGPKGLRVINITNPASPQGVGAYDTAGDAQSVTVMGGFVYVADGSNGLVVVSVENPASPQKVGEFDTPGTAYGLAATPSVSVTYAYIADGIKGLRVLKATGGTVEAESATACDMWGRCTTAVPTVTLTLPTLALDAPQDTPSLAASILNAPSVLDSLTAYTLTLWVAAPDYARALTVTDSLSGAPLYTQAWANGTLTETLIQIPWTPNGEGRHALTIAAADWLTGTITNAATVLVDTTSPAISLAANVITGTRYSPTGELAIGGPVTDTTAIAAVTLDLAGVGELSGVVDGPNWSATWQSNQISPPAGVSLPITLTVADFAGHATTINDTLTFDVLAPTPVELALSDAAGVITPGLTLRDISPTVTLTWTPSSDGSGLSNYLVDWTIVSTNTTHAQSSISNLQPLTSSFLGGEAQKLTVQLGSQDVYGNTRWQASGPIYLDSPLTPDYIALPDDGSTIYRGWQASTCSLVGVDNRIRDHAQPGAALDNAQSFYTTWDANGLRLSWTGANWDTDGDLFVYLDTRSGGSSRVYDPYHATMSNTVILLPATQADTLSTQRRIDARRAALQQQRGGALTQLAAEVQALDAQAASTTQQATATGQMAADYVIWVQDSAHATLLQWNPITTDWQVVDNDWTFVADTNAELPQTEVYLPFNTLGIANPAGANLSLVAFASANDALQLWATMPAHNSVTSPRVLDAVLTTGLTEFPLVQAYSWPSLGSGVCPNGFTTSMAQPATAHVAPQPVLANPLADVRLNLNAEPVGVAYSVLGDSLFNMMIRLSQFATLADWNTLHAQLCQLNPTDPACERTTSTNQPATTPANKSDLVRANLLPPPPGRGVPAASSQVPASTLDFDAADNLSTLKDVNHPALGDKQFVTYTLRYVNRGSGAATGLKADIVTWGQMRLPAGIPLSDDYGDYDWLLLDLGNVAPGEEKLITFAGQTDFAYDLTNNFGWATIDVIIYDDSGTVYNNQLDWLYLDHPLDRAAPIVGVQAVSTLLGPGQNSINGFVFDQSGVPTIELDIAGVSHACLDDTADDGQWACPIDLSGAIEGKTLSIRARATDEHGHLGEWSQPVVFTVDALTPTLALDAATVELLSQPALGAKEVTFSGRVSDNRLIDRVQLCADDSCATGQAVDLTLDQTSLPQTTFSYDDVPDAPLALDAKSRCYGGGEIQRTFTVTETFTVADVDLGLNVEHPYRYDVTAWLVAPSGAWTNVIFDGTSADNYDIRLNDTALLKNATDKANHDIAAPYFENQRRPDRSLSVFNGEAAQGEWNLILCDYIPDEDDGFYHRAQLILTAADLPVDSRGTWQYTVPDTGDQDGVARTLAFFGVDSVGNRTTPVLPVQFTVDTVAPVITVTAAITQVNLPSVVVAARDLITQAVILSGAVSDGHGVRNLYALVRDPYGDIFTQTLPIINGAWQFALPITNLGDFTVWVIAADEAGNSTTTQAQVKVNLPVLYQAWLPLMFNTLSGATNQTEIPDVGTPIPIETETPTPTATPTLAVEPPTPIGPETPAPTPTSILTPESTLEPPSIEITPWPATPAPDAL